MDKNAILKELYYTPGLPSCYGGVEVLLKEAKKRDSSFTKREIEEFLKRSLVYSRFKQTKNVYEKRKTLFYDKDEIWQVDLLDMQAFASENSNKKYILTCVDCLSRFLRAEAITTKGFNDVKQAMQKIFDKAGGNEFEGDKIVKWFESLGLKKWASSYTTTKASMVEAANKNLKLLIIKHFMKTGEKKYVDRLQDFVDTINKRKNRNLKMAPSDVTDEHVHDILMREIYPILFQDPEKVKFKHKVGDEVRVKTRKTTFQRGYDPPYSNKTWQIKERVPTIPPTYKLIDKTKKKKSEQHVDGHYYYNETSAFPASEETAEFQIKILESKKIRGKLKHKIVYIGYEKDKPIWIDDNMLVN